jgi:hypothetical protein
MNNILIATKELLGLPSSVTDFDTQLVVYINMALSTLNQMGVGEDGYQVTSADGDLEDFLPDDEDIRDLVQMYIYTKTRIMFDPPASSFVLAALQQGIAELEWRITNSQSE